MTNWLKQGLVQYIILGYTFHNLYTKSEDGMYVLLVNNVVAVFFDFL